MRQKGPKCQQQRSVISKAPGKLDMAYTDQFDRGIINESFMIKRKANYQFDTAQATP